MSAIVLAGGLSSRMSGANKPLMDFGDTTMIGRIINTLKVIFSEVLIVTKDRKLYQNYEVEVIIDELEHQGPLSGIHAGLRASKTKNNFIVSCDMPFLNLDLIRYMLEQSVGDILIPKVDGYLEPLHAIYSKNCIPKIEEVVKKGKFKITDLWKETNLNVKYIEQNEIKRFDPCLYTFFNVNTKEDYNQALDILTEVEKRNERN
ncbi:molybdenum cofactor guanylyltransferase [Sporohalobacter salinus]|uniref:molybdenum cofactor guanylyltransferase n=1 Tax=Sporohalobacter salinus TaxID=1494606 RepID=UPI00196138B6|nr:molybdenum cofactor guanylyltransferase [Sporohalobacter salinus]MBM7623090.1 molybdopterin-guanine dinucleotide biosynthesis protein A [Sporohalobacter salinus]